MNFKLSVVEPQPSENSYVKCCKNSKQLTLKLTLLFQVMNRVSVMITRRAFSSVFESKAHQEMIRSQFTQQALPFLEFHNEQDVLSVFQQLGQFKKTDRILDSG